MPVPVAVRHAARPAESGVIVEPGGVNAVVGAGHGERVGDPGRLVGDDRAAAAVAGSYALKQQPRLIRIPVVAEGVLLIVGPLLPFGGKPPASDQLDPR